MAKQLKYYRLKEYSIILLTLSLVMPIKINNIFVIFFLLTSIIRFNFKDYLGNLRLNKRVLIVSILFWLPLISQLYVVDFTNGWSHIEKNLAFLVIPMAVISYSDINKSEILKYFSISIFVISLLLLSYSLIQYFITEDIKKFFYLELVSPLNIHPIYFGMYFLFSASILFEWLKDSVARSTWVKLFFALYTTLLVVLISSKVILAGYIILIFIQFKHKKRYAFALMILITLCAALLPITRLRIMDVINSDWSVLKKEYFEYNEPFTGLTLRLTQWKLGLEHMLQDNNYFIGTGAGDAKAYINSIYNHHNLNAGGYTNYNMHSLYIDFFIKYGISGVICLICIFAQLIIAVKKKHHYSFWVFIFVFMLTGITENTLGLNKGIIFLAFFGSILLHENQLVANYK